MSLSEHLALGATTTCRAWAVTRRDGVTLGFTDHDRDLAFEGVVFLASTGVTARALQQSTGLSVDNSEAVGALTDGGVTEVDILAGRYDGAEVRCWLVNWADVAQRRLEFRGQIGDITRAGGAFQAELRGLADLLNQPQGRVFQRGCSAVLGDRACGVDLAKTGYAAEVEVEAVEDRRVFTFSSLSAFDDRWFERGRFLVLSGSAEGVIGVVKNDRLEADGRWVELWQALGPSVAPGDRVRIETGCDRRFETCRLKFANLTNFQGFPHIPGEDWLASYPTSGSPHDGGSLFR
ncbi:DUF2163 domain-containing protein [Falsirhodobacter sp. 20TX0035]|uniref:DUF2163 domain-containing protein n=1 Tax=Falsirhodobacter sp. 20TX0035 TaxID=3022019 RepID=UPI00232C468D|nr:DUF2163 domain-containing protein [Falsirhodobacter sp. 20TX0035]MDB6453243.1 DUF2163 domain-containing protein [Falsirhodobacter sp. 20TX0035]